MLPEKIQHINKAQVQTMELKGINYSDMLQEGDMVDSLNISARRYPYISTRKARTSQLFPSETRQLGVYNGKLILVTDTSIHYDIENPTNLLYNLTAGDKQIAIVNTKLVVFPDKKMYDFATDTVSNLEATLNGGAYFSTDSLYLYTGVRGIVVGAGFKKGDTIKISGCTVEDNNKYITIKSITYNDETGFSRIRTSDDAFIAVADASTPSEYIQMDREVPDMDFICESENRLWGCSNDEKTIYASALGDPTNFYTYEGLSTDSYAVAVGSEGDFTGCCKLGSSVLFWKEEYMHKMLGSYPAQYTMYTSKIEGIPSGSHKSMQVINDTLYYLGLHGVYAYNGSYPVCISTNFGEKQFNNGVGGNDGDSYFLSCADNDNNSYLFVYEIKYGLWIKEDDAYVSSFARIGRKAYFLIQGTIYLAYDNAEEPDLEWMVQFAPMYESIEGKKSYSKIILRVDIPEDSYLIFETRQDGSVWKEMGRIVGSQTNLRTMYMPRMRCDKFEIRMHGKGSMTILGMMRDFILGSEVR